MIVPHIPSVKLRINYPIVLRWSSLSSIIIITLMLLIIPRVQIQALDNSDIIFTEFEQIDIPQTEQVNIPPPPARPTIPIESESEDIPDDLTIEETTFESFDAFNWDPPPPPNSGPKIKFVPYDTAPQPIGGYAAIKANVKYPELAREAGVDGTVIVQAHIDVKGRVIDTIILSGVPNSGLNEAAIFVYLLGSRRNTLNLINS